MNFVAQTQKSEYSHNKEVISIKNPNEPSPELIELCASGDRSALNTFFELYSKEIYNFPLKVFHLDEDAASDFFLYAYERLSNGVRFRSYQKRSSFRTWFYAVLRNLVIDWMRTLREIEFVEVKQHANQEMNFDFIANIIDPRSIKDKGDDTLSQFTQKLKLLPMEMRLILKLSYIYYLDIDNEERLYLSKQKQVSVDEVNSQLLKMRNELSSKEIKNLHSEDKITSLYLSITELKHKRERIKQQLEQMNSNSSQSTLSIELEKLEHILEKKRLQHKKILSKKSKGHFVARTPYRQVAKFLGITEGNVSVQMMRSIERLQNNITLP